MRFVRRGKPHPTPPPPPQENGRLPLQEAECIRNSCRKHGLNPAWGRVCRAMAHSRFRREAHSRRRWKGPTDPRDPCQPQGHQLGQNGAEFGDEENKT